MHASVNYVNKGSNNGTLPERRQAIIRTNAGMLSKVPLGTNSDDIVIQMRSFSLNIFYLENVVCKIPAILTRPQCVKAPDMVIALTALTSSWQGQLGTTYMYFS